MQTRKWVFAIFSALSTALPVVAQSITLRLPPEQAQASSGNFNLTMPGSYYGMPVSVGSGYTSGYGSGELIKYPNGQGGWRYDSVATVLWYYGMTPLAGRLTAWGDMNEWATIDFDPAMNVLDFRDSIWLPWGRYYGASDMAPRQFFLPASDAGRSLSLVQSIDGVLMTTVVSTETAMVAIYDAPGGTVVDSEYATIASGMVYPASPFWLVDTSVWPPLRAPTGKTNLAGVTWVPDYSFIPVATANIYLPAVEDGHRFTLTRRAAGGPEVSDAVVARVRDAGGNLLVPEDTTVRVWDGSSSGEFVFVPAGSAVIQQPIGVGMQFWVTRLADGLSLPVGNGTLEVHDPWSSFEINNWVFLNDLPNPPQRPSWAQSTVWIRINRAREGHRFTLGRGDGYDYNWDTATGGSPWTAGTVSSDAGGAIWNPLDVMEVFAVVDARFPWWLRDDTTGEDFAVGQTDVLDGWRAVHEQPQPSSSFTLQVTAPRMGDSYRLFSSRAAHGRWVANNAQPGDVLLEEFSTESWQSGMETWTDALSGQQHEVAVGNIIFSNPLPTQGGPFYLFDATRGDGCEIAAGVNNLRDWIVPAQTLALRLPTSRFGHNLVVRHIDGTERAITQNQSQGGYTFDPALSTAWWNFYYWFDGVGSSHAGVPWHVYDKTADELAAVNSTDLTEWVSPWAGWQNTNATVADAVTISLGWTADLDDNTGSFVIERRIGNGPWQQVATAYGGDYSMSGSAWNSERQMTLARYTYSSVVSSVPGASNTFRLRYLYSGHYSSAVLAGVPVPADYDNDGLPTSWEVLHGFDPNLANDASADSDGDGLSDWKEYLYGLNPTQPAVTGAANHGYLTLTVLTPLE